MSETAKRCNAPLALLPCDLLRFIPGYGSALRVTLSFRIKSLQIDRPRSTVSRTVSFILRGDGKSFMIVRMEEKVVLVMLSEEINN